MKHYCLKSPDGDLKYSTVASSKRDVWGDSFEIVALHEGNDWRLKYWKKWDESLASAKKLGWKIVEVKLVEIKK